MNSSVSSWKAPLVSQELRERNSRCYVPHLLSVGPVFHGLPSVKDIEDLKPKISRNFIQECVNSAPPTDVDMYKKKLIDVCLLIKSSYSEEIRSRYTDWQFCEMFLIDVCFLVVLIHCIVSKNERNLPLSPSVLRMCLRDLFLLENQVPFLLVEDLVNLRFGREGIGMILQCLSAVIHHPLRAGDMPEQPIHLLDLLRQMCIGNERPCVKSSDTHWSTFLPAKQLHDRGIRIWAAASHKVGYSLVHMEFDGSRGNLYMPSALIDESFESVFLNIAAYEASENDPQKSVVTTYLRLMQHLAQDSESVSILREHVIFSKEDNNSIAQMFQRMSENLHPNYEIYDRLLLELQNFPSGYAASIMCWFRKPSMAHLISLFFVTTLFLAIIVALADLLSFSGNTNKVINGASFATL